MNTLQFRTRQEFVESKSPKGDSFIVGLDIGYSSTKVFHENGHFVFPSYVMKINKMMNVSSDKDIFYRDANGEKYIVGYNAQEMLQSNATNDTDNELFGRNRYKDKRFKIICNVAIALAISKKNDDRPIIIQTGLPSAYVKMDTSKIKKAIASHDEFDIKVGNGNWIPCKLNVNDWDVKVMDQPAGALYSSIMTDEGLFGRDAKTVLSADTLVMDIGFGTFDFYGFQNRNLVCRESIDDIGMKKVFQETVKLIEHEYGEEIKVPALQKILSTGNVTCFDEETMSSEDKPIMEFLEKANKKVMLEAMEKAKNITQAFRGYRYIIIDGGTGEAWYDYISDWLKNMKTITLLKSNKNDGLSFIYSNARGYYMFCLNVSTPKAEPKT